MRRSVGKGGGTGSPQRSASRTPCPPWAVRLASRLMVGTAHESLSFALKAVPAPLPTLQGCYLASRSLQSYVLREIVIGTAVAFKPPADGAAVIAATEHLGEEALLRGPAGVGLRLAIAARHGVVEPAMRRVLVDVDVVALLVRFEAVAEAPHIIERDDVIGLAKGAEHRAGQCRDDVIERFRLQLVDLPFALACGAVPHHGGADRHLRGEHQGVPAGLAITADRDPCSIGNLVLAHRG